MSRYASSLRRVLVATDLSSHAELAIERALQLAATNGAEVDIVHVIDEGLCTEAERQLAATRHKSIQDKLANVPFAGEVKVTTSIIARRPEPDIVERAVMFEADCIVLGLHDRLLEENRAIVRHHNF
jgi:nucleotide-binding universal stress UspA family protein